MKILIVAAGYPPDIRGGGEFSTKFLSEALVAAGAEVCVLAASSADASEVANGVEIQRCATPNPPWNFERRRSRVQKLRWHIRDNWNPAAVNLVRRHIQRARPDLVVSSTIENFGGSSWIAAKAEKVRSVHILRSYYTVCWRGSMFKNGLNCTGRCLDCRILSFGRWKASRNVDAVIGISFDVLNRHLSEGAFPHARTIVLRDPVPAEYFGTPRARQGVPPTFGFLGVLTANKGVETLAASWRAMGDTPARLLIGGTGKDEYVTGLRDAMPASVEFLGWVKPVEFLDRVDFLVVPSVWHEPFGRIVVEAFARGVPVIGSRTGGIGEMVEEGETGFLFEPGSAQRLSEAIGKALALAPQEYAEMSRKSIESADRFHARHIANLHIAYFEELLGGPV